MKPAALLLLPFFLATLSKASTIIDPLDDPTITAQMYRDEAALYPSVGKVTGGGLDGSGVLIGDRWVLTAGHISMSKTGGSFQIGGETYTIESIVTHPQHNFITSFSDIGLLYLDRAVSSVGAAAMGWFENPASILGMEATWVGHGHSGTGLTGQQLPIEFRAFTNIIDVFGSHPEYGVASTSFVADFDQPGNPDTNAPASDAFATRLEGNLTSGDSGGGVFVEIDGEMRLIGINSFAARFGPGTTGIYGHLSGATDLSLFHDWIYQHTGIVPVPEPNALMLASLGGLGFLRRRR